MQNSERDLGQRSRKEEHLSQLRKCSQLTQTAHSTNSKRLRLQLPQPWHYVPAPATGLRHSQAPHSALWLLHQQPQPWDPPTHHSPTAHPPNPNLPQSHRPRNPPPPHSHSTHDSATVPHPSKPNNHNNNHHLLPNKTTTPPQCPPQPPLPLPLPTPPPSSPNPSTAASPNPTTTSP